MPLLGKRHPSVKRFRGSRHLWEHAHMTRQILRSGQVVERSGIYRDPISGERTTLVEGKTAPPTPEKGGVWQEVVDTHPGKRDGSGRKR